jgi:protein-L-isoaspartate(D-aspartate) O-methyltransferase
MSGFIDSEGQIVEPDAKHYQAAAEFVLMLRQKGVRDTSVLRAMEQVARVPFIREDYLTLADEDLSLPLNAGQMMLAPSILAKLIEALQIEKPHRVLILGAGSGYSAALISRLALEVVTVERVKSLADAAHSSLRKQGYSRIEVIYGDAYDGYTPKMPYDRVLSTFAFTDFPTDVLSQLVEGGRIIAPFMDKGVFSGVKLNGAIEFEPLPIDFTMIKGRTNINRYL